MIRPNGLNPILLGYYGHTRWYVLILFYDYCIHRVKFATDSFGVPGKHRGGGWDGGSEISEKSCWEFFASNNISAKQFQILVEKKTHFVGQPFSVFNTFIT